MPQTFKKFRGHIAFGLSVLILFCLSFFICQGPAYARILKCHYHEKKHGTVENYNPWILALKLISTVSHFYWNRSTQPDED